MLALNGVDAGAFVRSRDPAERLVLMAVAGQVAEWRERDEDIARKNLANEVGGRVGSIVGQALVAIAKAVR